jgi:hypothetical protein
MIRILRLAVVFGFIFCTGAFAQTKDSPEDAAYAKLKPGSLSDLKDYADKFPSGKNHASVIDAISVLEDFEKIRAKATTPKCEISFSTLGKWNDGGSVWENYKKVSPAVEGAGFFTTGTTAGIFSPIAGTGHTISFGNSGFPLWPAGDGSIWGIDSPGKVLWLFPGLKIQTKERTLIGVIGDRGLVCLRGSGTLTLVDENGREVTY